MAEIDRAKERRRLAEHYAKLPDGGLRELAAEAYRLTELGRDALQEEISRRGLAIELRAAPPTTEHSVTAPRILLRQFRDLPEAFLALSLLKSADIECSLEDDNVVRTDWLWSNAVGGVKLYGGAEEASIAAQILDQPPPENFDIEELGTYQQPKCPQCGSLDISFNELDRPVAYSTLFFGIPLPWTRRGWRCHGCENRWEEESAGPPHA
jgi:hypothetical protein